MKGASPCAFGSTSSRYDCTTWAGGARGARRRTGSLLAFFLDGLGRLDSGKAGCIEQAITTARLPFRARGRRRHTQHHNSNTHSDLKSARRIGLGTGPSTCRCTVARGRRKCLVVGDILLLLSGNEGELLTPAVEGAVRTHRLPATPIQTNRFLKIFG